MSIWGEIRNEFDDDSNIDDVYGYLTADDNESPNIIAKVNWETGTVEYLDDRARTDSYAQEMIKEILNDILRAGETRD